MKLKIVYGKPIRYFVDGVEITEKEYRKRFPKPKVLPRVQALMETSKAWPRKSDAFGVHPKQKEKAEAFYAKLGVPTEIDSDGCAIIRNNAHQRDLLKARGWHNNDGGYGGVAS